jgi:hypothetical protein
MPSLQVEAGAALDAIVAGIVDRCRVTKEQEFFARVIPRTQVRCTRSLYCIAANLSAGID